MAVSAAAIRPPVQDFGGDDLQLLPAAGQQHALGGFAYFMIEHQRLGFDRGDGLGGDAFAAAGEASPSVVVALTLTRSGSMPGIRAMLAHHGVAMRADARRSQTSVRSRCTMRPPRAVEQADGVAQEPVRRHAAPRAIGGREMLADVAGADRAQDRIGQRMQRDVGIRIAGERVVVRNRDAAQHHRVAGPETMHVEAQGGAGLHRDAARQILGRRDLAVVLAAFDHDHPQSGALRDRCVIGQGGRPAAPSAAASRCARSSAA